MLGFLPSCLRRHKKKLLFLGGVVGGIAVLNTFVKKKFLEWEVQRTSDICDQLKRSNHFEGTVKTCDSVFESLVPKIRHMIAKAIDVNQVVKQVSANPPNKIQLWEELKIMVFTQALGEMYSLCFLCILLRVQMSILSGYAFTSRCSNGAATEKQQMYLARIEDFMLNGIDKLLKRIRLAVEENLQSVPLYSSLKLNDIEIRIKSIHDSIFCNDSKLFMDISSYLMPPSSSTETPDEFLDNISMETVDVLECDDFNTVLQSCADCGISLLMDRFSECYGVLSNGKDEFVNPHDFPSPLAKLIPVMHNVFSQHPPLEPGGLAHNLLKLDSLNNFAANIYEAFSQKP